MTKIPNPESLAPGPNLDKLVAEHILSWKWVQVRPSLDPAAPRANPGRFLRPGSEAESDFYVPADMRAPIWEQMQDVPPFSTHIAQAWEIVEELDQRGFHWKIQTPFAPGRAFFAGFTPHNTTGWNGRPDFLGEGETAPAAICRAALDGFLKSAG